MTSRQFASLLWLALPLALFVAGCQKDAAEEAEAASADETVVETPTETAAEPVAEPIAETKVVEAPPLPAPVPGTDAAIIETRSTPIAAAPSFDANAFAGHYVSGGTALEVTADGMFALNIDGGAIDGTWTLMPGGKMVVLDPDSKGETDRRIEVLSNDSVKIVGGATLTRHDETQ
jgi:hypothetical protein